MFKGSDYRRRVRLYRTQPAVFVEDSVSQMFITRNSKWTRCEVCQKLSFKSIGSYINLEDIHWFSIVFRQEPLYIIYLRTPKKAAIQGSVKRLFFRSGARDGWHWASLGQDLIMKQAVPGKFKP